MKKNENKEKRSVELNTGVLRILDVDLYSRSELLNEFEFDNYSDLDNILKDISIPIIENTILEVLSSAKVNFKEVYHPKYYNYDTDCIVFDLEFDAKEFEELKEKTIKNKDFEKYLKDNYSSYSGFISTMADNLNDFENQKEWKSICQILEFNINKENIKNANDEFDDLFYNELVCNFDYAE